MKIFLLVHNSRCFLRSICFVTNIGMKKRDWTNSRRQVCQFAGVCTRELEMILISVAIRYWPILPKTFVRRYRESRGKKLIQKFAQGTYFLWLSSEWIKKFLSKEYKNASPRKIAYSLWGISESHIALILINLNCLTRTTSNGKFSIKTYATWTWRLLKSSCLWPF